MMIAALAGFLFAEPLLVRRAEVNISPPEPLPLGGYTERKGKLLSPGGDPLFARCIQLEQGSAKVAIVSVDMLTVPESLYREVAVRLPKDTQLFLQATHTHCAPDSQMLNERMTLSIPGIANYRRRWLTWYADKIASAVTAASASPPVKLNSLTLVRQTNAANRARRKGGKPDRTLTKVFGDPQAEPLFVHYTAHPIVYDHTENRTRTDWPGAVGRQLKSMVLNGAIGDVSPAADGPTADQRMQDFLGRFHRASRPVALALWSPAQPLLAKPLLWAKASIPLGGKKPHPGFGKEYKVPDVLAQSLIQQYAPESAEVAAFRIGALAVVGIPGEPTSALGTQIRQAGERMGFKSVLVCSHVNGWMGYVLEPKDYDRGEYEATLSFYGREQGPRLVQGAITALRTLR